MEQQDIKQRALDALEKLAEKVPGAWEGLAMEYAESQVAGAVGCAAMMALCVVISIGFFKGSTRVSDPDAAGCLGCLAVVAAIGAVASLAVGVSFAIDAFAPNVALLRELL